jgi:hypothetical protein
VRDGPLHGRRVPGRWLRSGTSRCWHELLQDWYRACRHPRPAVDTVAVEGLAPARSAVDLLVGFVQQRLGTFRRVQTGFEQPVLCRMQAVAHPGK